ncbi:hypothetical protein BDR05DRAFT_751019 [Suillus weaverae]|nr:hypothetical protein BDR05DRAFT_751019 [Suillus weaverae]
MDLILLLPSCALPLFIDARHMPATPSLCAHCTVNMHAGDSKLSGVSLIILCNASPRDQRGLDRSPGADVTWGHACLKRRFHCRHQHRLRRL